MLRSLSNILIVLLTLGLVGCTPALLGTVGGMFGLGGDKPALSVDAQIGKEANKQIIVGDQDRTNLEIDAERDAYVTTNTTKANTQQDFMGDVGRVVISNVSPLYLVLLIAGWVLPTPHQMWLAVKSRFKTKKDRE